MEKSKSKEPDALLRMRFLYQAANAVSGVLPVLGAALGHQTKQIGLKSQIKIDREIKRTICRGCHGVLLPGKTADIAIEGRHKAQKKIAITCNLCCTKKAFPLDKNKNKVSDKRLKKKALKEKAFRKQEEAKAKQVELMRQKQKAASKQRKKEFSAQSPRAGERESWTNVNQIVKDLISSLNISGLLSLKDMSKAGEEANYVEPLLEFLEVVIHQILYRRDLYPSNIFVLRKKFRIAVMMSEHPWVNEYIENTLNSLHKHVTQSQNADINSIQIVIGRNNRALERYCLEFDMRRIRQPLQNSDRFLIQLELCFVSFLSRLDYVLGEMGKLVEPSPTETKGHLAAESCQPKEPEPYLDPSWWIELATNERGALPLARSQAWAVTTSPGSAEDVGSSVSIVPVMGTDQPFQMQLYVEKTKPTSTR